MAVKGGLLQAILNELVKAGAVIDAAQWAEFDKDIG